MKSIFKICFGVGIIILLICGLWKGGDELKIAGSSTVYPITSRAQDGYLDTYPGGKISIQENGTGGGFVQFSAGDVYINNASREIKEEEAKAAKKNDISYVPVQIGLDGITVVINKENVFAQSLTHDELHKLFSENSKIKKWSDLNPEYPNKKINFYGPTTASGTYDFFVETIIGKDAGEALRSDMVATENDNEIVSNVSRDEYGIGFMGYAFYSTNKDLVKPVLVDDVEPTIQNIKEGKYLISRPLYLYVNVGVLQQKENKMYREFMRYYLDHVTELVEDSGYVALSKKENVEQRENYEEALKNK